MLVNQLVRDKYPNRIMRKQQEDKSQKKYKYPLNI